MKQGKSLVELAAELESRKAAKVDFIAPAKDLHMVVAPVADDVNGPRTEASLEVPNQGIYPISSIAHDQIGQYTGVPAKYYDRMLAEDPQLLAANVNRWLRDSKDKRMVRTLRNVNRAFLSNRYQRIENEEIAEVALPILIGDKNLQVVSAEVTEKRLYIQATTSRVTGEVKRGDVVQAGVIISNSEVGYGAVSVQRVIYRLVCLNGLILPENKFRANHTGARLDDNEALWQDDTKKAEDKAVLLKVRDMVNSAMDEGFFQKQLEKLQDTTQQKIVGNPVKAVEILGQKLGVTNAEQGSILRALIEGADLSRWGVVNAVTAQAHVANDYDRSVDFERMGSNVIDLSPGEWKEIAEAA